MGCSFPTQGGAWGPGDRGQRHMGVCLWVPIGHPQGCGGGSWRIQSQVQLRDIRACSVPSGTYSCGWKTAGEQAWTRKGPGQAGVGQSGIWTGEGDGEELPSHAHWPGCTWPAGVPRGRPQAWSRFLTYRAVSEPIWGGRRSAHPGKETRTDTHLSNWEKCFLGLGCILRAKTTWMLKLPRTAGSSSKRGFCSAGPRASKTNVTLSESCLRPAPISVCAHGCHFQLERATTPFCLP